MRISADGFASAEIFPGASPDSGLLIFDLFQMTIAAVISDSGNTSDRRDYLQNLLRRAP
jgi:hypothetical protein